MLAHVNEALGALWHGVKKDARGAIIGAASSVLTYAGGAAIVGGPIGIKVAAGAAVGGAIYGSVKGSTDWLYIPLMGYHVFRAKGTT